MLTGIDYTIMGAFLAATVITGLWFARRWRGSEDFFLAGRKLTWPLIGLSLFATNISTEHFVGLAGAGFDTGLVTGGYEWMASYCLLVLAVVFAPQYVKHKVFTIPEFFEKRFGVETRAALTAYFLVMIVLTKCAVAVYGGARVIEHFTGWDREIIMWSIGIITAAYTMAGGLTAVVYTDFIQAIVLITGSTILTGVALTEVGGWSGLTERLAEADRSDMLSMVRPSTDPDLPFTGFILGNFLIGGMFYWCMDQVNVQRVLGARDVTQARRGALFAGFLKIIPVFIMVLPGVVGAVLYADRIEHPDETYPVLVEQLLGEGLRGLVLAALFAALMSSLSSTFNSAATIGARDIVARYWPRSTVRRQILVGQIALLTVMVLGIVVASSGVIEESENLWQYLQTVTAYLSAPFAVAGLLGVFSRRVNRAGALTGITAGIAAGVALFVDSIARGGPWLSHPLFASFLHRAAIAGAIAAVTMLVTSYLTRPPPKEVTDGTFHVFSRDRRDDGLAKDAPWILALFVIVTALWWIFR